MKYRGIISAIICSAVISGCSPAGKPEKTVHNDEEVSRLVEAMDTSMSIKAYGENAEKALDEAENEIMALDKKLRRGSGDSEIYTVNTAGCAEVSEETAELISDALSICSSTDGAFDISIAPIMDLWGFYTGGYRVPTEGELARTLDTVDYNNISIDGKTVTVSGGSQIDLGGIAKGYLSSRIMEIMADNGVTSGIISLGGNVQALGTKTDGSDWRVAIQDPDNSEDYIGLVKISDKAVITSGGYQRFFEQDGRIYHHIINPSDGYPSDSGLKSVSIISSDGTLADGLSTALFVMGPDAAAEYWKTHSGFDVIFVTDDNRILITEGIEDIFESPRGYSVINR